MPIDRSRTPLYITLIVFVMLSFVLAITSYLFYQQLTVARKDKADAEAQRAAATRELNPEDTSSLAYAKIALTKRIGTVKQDSVATVESECNELFTKYFSPDYKGEKTFMILVQKLNADLEALQKKGRDRDQEKAELELAKTKALEQAEESRAQAEQQVAEARQEMANAKQEFQRQRGETDKAMEDIRGKQDDAEKRVTQLDLLLKEVAELGKFLTNDVRRIHPEKGKVRESKNRKERFEAEASEVGKIGLVREELEFANATIRDLNDTLVRLRVADPSLQLVVRRAIPRGDIIDGFDGRVIEVDEADRSVLLWMPSTAALRPGLVFSVFNAAVPRPAEGDRKATVQVVQIEGNSVARARIESDYLGEPILAGDAVASSLWSPGVVTEIVVVGYVDIAGSANGYETLKAELERAGARVSEVVTARTSLVVDAGPPRAAQVAAGRVKNWRQPDEDRRNKAMKSAKEAGVRVVGLEGLFDMLGLDPMAFRGNVLPRAGSTGTPGAF
jgi:hypothetical protein